MQDKREYKIKIDPRIMELLGPSLYTNIYFVLAELIANSYDANASNVYIIQKDDRIIVEDDGTGMSYQAGDIKKYLNVAIETRTTEEDTYTEDGTRKKIGRKGVGKLAALSVSENVLVMTIKNDEKSGFVLSRHVGEDHQLEPLKDDGIRFERITGNGTSIVMTNPQYGMHKTVAAIKNNLLKIFPLVNEKFRIHIITDKEEVVVDSFDKEMIQGLAALIILGDKYHRLSENFDSTLADKEEVEKKLLITDNAISESLTLKNRKGEEKEFNLEIKGWIGAYRSTRGRKIHRRDFPDNFISLLAHGKMGEYNILPIVGKNRLVEVYIVGQLHVDLFEETELPDMALSNRQGYKTDDLRYVFVIDQVRDNLLPRIVAMREAFADYQKKIRDKAKLERQKKDEEELRKKVDEYKATASRMAADKIAAKLGRETYEDIKQIIKGEMNESLPIVGLKRKIDSQKKKILISHTSTDKALADVVYKMLSFNEISDEDIIYTSCDNEGARIPEATGVFDYLEEFFVNSYSDEKILVLYITSDEMAQAWGAVIEAGAGWITRKHHKIFNVKGHRPQLPLNIEAEWQTSLKEGDDIKMTQVEFDKFIVKVRDICNRLGYDAKTKEANENELKRYVSLLS